MRSLSGLTVLAALFLVFATARSSHAGFPIPIPMADVGGVVTNVDSGDAVAGVRVLLINADGDLVGVQKTDRTGVFVFGDLPVGAYVLSVQGGESTPIFAGPLAYFYTLTTSL